MASKTKRHKKNRPEAAEVNLRQTVVEHILSRMTELMETPVIPLLLSRDKYLSLAARDIETEFPDIKVVFESSGSNITKHEQSSI